MKTSMLSLILLLVFHCKAQTYIPMPFETGMLWRTHFMHNMDQGQNDDRLIGDTIINGKSYKIVWLNKYDAGIGPMPGWFPANVLHGFVREDTLNKKVYSPSGLNEAVLYDFNLQVGDTIHGYQLSGFKNAGVDTIRVASIDLMLINGVFHKRFTSTPIQNLTGGAHYIFVEGIGALNGFLDILIGFEAGSGLMCVGKEYLKSLYPDSLTECIYALNIAEQNFFPRLVVSPNPASDLIYVQSQDDFSDMWISDILGNRILLSHDFNGHKPIDISDLPDGFYILNLSNKKGKNVFRRFCKQ